MSKIKTASLAVTLGVLSGTVVVQAADLPLRTAAPTFMAPIVINNWDGLYAGTTFGYGFTDFKTRQGSASSKVSASGITSGGVIGYNVQFGHFVAGAEGSIDINDVRTTTNVGGGIGPMTLNSLYDIRLRGRLGYEFGWLMPFVAGGAVINETYQAQSQPRNDFGQNQQSVGYTIGGGVDVKLNPARLLGFNNSFLSTFLGPLILRVEYIHDELPNSTFAFNGKSYSTNSSTNLVRAAIISRFGDNPPRPYVDKMGDVNWSGSYGGVFGGGASLTPRTAFSGSGGGKTHFDASGALGGLYAGTNFMVFNRVMLGIEGSTAYTDITGRGSEPTGTASFRNYVQADVRGRVGYAFGNLLPFVAAGVLFGQSEQTDVLTGSHRGFVRSEALTVGGGLDYRVTERVSVRGEYLYASTFRNTLVSLNGCSCKQDLDSNIFRIGAAYHFE